MSLPYPISTTVSVSGITIKYSDASRQRITYNDDILGPTFGLNSGLNVAQDADLSEKLTVTGPAWFKSTLRVDHGIFFNSAIVASRSSILGDALTVNGSSRLNGSSYLNSSLIVENKTTFKEDLELFNNANMTSSLIVGGIANLNSNVIMAKASGNALVVSGDTKLKSSVNAHSAFEVKDISILNSSLTVGGVANMNNMVIMSTLSGDALQVTGTSNFQKPVIMDSSLTVANASKFYSTFRANEQTAVNNSLTITKASGEALHVNGTAKLNGITVMGSTLSVVNDATLNSTLTVSNKVFFNDALDVHKAAHFKSSIIVDGLFNPIGGMVITGGSNGLTIVGASGLNGSASLKSSLEVKDDMYISSNLTVKGWSKLDSSVMITLDPSRGDALIVDGSTKLHGVAALTSSLSVKSAASLLNTVDISGQSNLHNTFDVAGIALMKSSIEVSKLTNLRQGMFISRVSAGDALSVIGSANVSSSVNVDQSLDVSGAVHLKSSLEVDKSSELRSTLNIKYLVGGNALTLAGDALFNDPVTLASTFVLSNIANMNNSMTVNGVSQLNKKLVINRSSEGDALSVSGPSYFSSAVVGGSSITVSGATNFQGILVVSEKVTLSSTLNVTGASLLKSTIKVDNLTDVQNRLTINEVIGGVGSTLTVAGSSQFMSSVGISGALHVNNDLCMFSTVSMSKASGICLNIAGLTTFNNDVTIVSSLTVNGDYSLISSNIMKVKDNAILIADSNNADDISAGIMLQYKPHETSSIQYAGIRRKAGGDFIFYKDAIAQIPNTGAGSDSTTAGIPAVVVAESFTCSSDSRLKKNIISLDGALDKIDNFEGVYHDWIDENQKDRAIGVIAQDVQKVYPELINEGTDGFLAVNYPKLTAVLLQSIKELKSMVVNVIERRKVAVSQK